MSGLTRRAFLKRAAASAVAAAVAPTVPELADTDRFVVGYHGSHRKNYRFYAHPLDIGIPGPTVDGGGPAFPLGAHASRVLPSITVASEDGEAA